MAKKDIVIKGSDLEVIALTLGQEKRVPQSDWEIISDENPKVAWCYTFGCPNGNGAYLQCLFGADQSLLDAKIIEADGRVCGCNWCKPKKKPKRRK